MLCNCRNCKHARPNDEGIMCYKKLSFTLPNNRCNDFDAEKTIEVWNNPITWVAIVAVICIALLNVLL